MSRRRFTERQTLECAIRQGAVIPCFRCKAPFTVDDVKLAEREHIHEVALAGPDTVEACAFSHRACHALVTFGSKATTAGSSIHRVRKADRIARGGRKVKMDGKPRRSRPFRKAPPGHKYFQSGRGFR